LPLPLSDLAVASGQHFGCERLLKAAFIGDRIGGAVNPIGAAIFTRQDDFAMSTVTCLHCLGTVLYASELAGKQVACPHCQRVFAMPVNPSPLPTATGHSGRHRQTPAGLTEVPVQEQIHWTEPTAPPVQEETPEQYRQPIVDSPPVTVATQAPRPSGPRPDWRGVWESLSAWLARRTSSSPENAKWAIGGFAAGIAACLIVMIGLSAVRGLIGSLPLPAVGAGDERTVGDFIQYAKRCSVDYRHIYADGESVVLSPFPAIVEWDNPGAQDICAVRVFRFENQGQAIEWCKRHDGAIRNGIWVMQGGIQATPSDKLRRAFNDW